MTGRAVSEAELVRLRSIQNVVRLGRVTHIGLTGSNWSTGRSRRPAGRSTMPPARSATISTTR